MGGSGCPRKFIYFQSRAGQGRVYPRGDPGGWGEGGRACGSAARFTSTRVPAGGGWPGLGLWGLCEGSRPFPGDVGGLAAESGRGLSCVVVHLIDKTINSRARLWDSSVISPF